MIFAMNIFASKKWFLVLLALINFAAGIYSISYYLPQLSVTNPLLWIFVIDCPFYAILFGVVVLLLAAGIRSGLLGLVSIVGSIKYGLWTIFVFLLLPNPLTYSMFLLSHALLIIETIVLWKVFSFKVKHFLVALLWFLANDYLDYALGLHPWFEEQYFVLVACFAIASSIMLTFLVSVLFSLREGVPTLPRQDAKAPHKQTSQRHVQEHKGKWKHRK